MCKRVIAVGIIQCLIIECLASKPKVRDGKACLCDEDLVFHGNPFENSPPDSMEGVQNINPVVIKQIVHRVPNNAIESANEPADDISAKKDIDLYILEDPVSNSREKTAQEEELDEYDKEVISIETIFLQMNIEKMKNKVQKIINLLEKRSLFLLIG